MSKLIELYVMELTREGATMTIEEVPAGRRKQVADAVAKAAKATEKAGD